MLARLALLMLALGVIIRPADAAVLTVTTTADTVSGNCTPALCSLKDAFAYAAANGPTNAIVLATGATYVVATPFSGTEAFAQVSNSVTVLGNGAVIERDPTAGPIRFLWITGSGSLDLQDVTLRNGLNVMGGAIVNNFGALSISRGIFEYNGAANGNGRGGAIYSAGVGPLTINRTTFRGNTGIIGGALFAFNFGSPAQVYINDSAFVGNAVATVLPNWAIGGAIDFGEDVNVAITSTTFSGNTSDNIAGAIGFSLVQPTSVITLLNTTIVQNYAAFAGGGLGAESCSASCPIVDHPILINTILANNTSAGPLVANCFGPYESGDHNILGPPVMQNVNCNVFNQGSNDILLSGSLANIQGLGTTGLAGGEHHALLAGSIAIDTANPALCPAIDQIQAGRIVVCERGAIEYHPPAPTIDPCQAGKKNCIANKLEALLKCHSKAEQQGFVLSPKCKQKAFDAFTGYPKSCCDKLETKYPCPTEGDCALLEAKVDQFVETVVQALDPFYPNPIPNGNLCSSKKKKCVSNKAVALLKCHVKAERTGVVQTKCLQKARDKFDGGTVPANSCFEQLENTTGLFCLTYDDTAALEAIVDAFVDDVICHLDPAAGTCPTIPTPTPSVTPQPSVTPTPP